MEACATAIENPPRASPSAPGFAASVALHLALFGVLLLIVPKPAPRPPSEKRIAVEILDPAQFEAVYRSPAGALPAPQLPDGLALPQNPPDIISFPADLPLPPHSGEKIVARRFLSATAFDDPRSAKAKAALSAMLPDEKAIQLCNIEALEQITALDAEYQPDLLTAYSMQSVRLSATSVNAPGAAFRSRGQWFGVAFDCALTPDLAEVVAFEFRIGKAIPHEKWARYNLAEGEDLDDN
jgi:hypothetical protein